MAGPCHDLDPTTGSGPGRESVAHGRIGCTASFGPYHGHVHWLHAGEVLLHQGAPVDALFRIRRGLVKLMIYLPGGEVRIVRLQRAGDWLGLEGFLDEPSSHTAIVLGKVVVERYSMEHLVHMRHDDVETLNDLMSQWYRDLAAADVWIAEFSTGVIRQRVARLIHYLAETSNAGTSRVQLPSVREMGEILGVRPEGVSRVIAGLKRRAILVPDGDDRHDTFRVQLARLAARRDRPAATAPVSGPQPHGRFGHPAAIR